MSMFSLIDNRRGATRSVTDRFAALFARIRDSRRAVRDLADLREIGPHLLADIGFDDLAQEELQRRHQTTTWRTAALSQ